MQINDTIFIVTPVTLYGNILPQSAQILKATVIEILKDKVTVKISLGNGEFMIQEVKEPYYKTFHDALPHIEPLINPKVKPLREDEYIGENPENHKAGIAYDVDGSVKGSETFSNS